MDGRVWGGVALGAAVGAICVGLGVGWSEPSDPLPAGGPGVGPETARRIAMLDREIAELRGRVAEEARLRARLADEVADLEDRLARVGRTTARPAPADDPPEDVPTAEAVAIDPAGNGDETLDVATLVRAGFDPIAVEDYRRRHDELELERLYLRDRAAREGWIGTDRFRQEAEAISSERQRMDEDYGPEFQDWLRYASGRPNRVGVTDVMAGSPAELAGLRSGDLVLSYGGSRIHHPGELVRETRGGVAGESVEVEVLRNGRRVVVDVPRGPLGVRTEPLRREPPAPG